MINREDLLNKPHRGYSVCEDHFAEHDVLPGSRRKILKKRTLPTLKLPNSQKKDEETQTIVVTTTSKSVQSEYTLTVLIDRATQTPAHLSANTPRKRKLQSDLSATKKKLKNDVDSQTHNDEIDMLHRLCDKLLTKELAKSVKEQTDLKLNNKGN